MLIINIEIDTVTDRKSFRDAIAKFKFPGKGNQREQLVTRKEGGCQTKNDPVFGTKEV